MTLLVGYDSFRRLFGAIALALFALAPAFAEAGASDPAAWVEPSASSLFPAKNIVGEAGRAYVHVPTFGASTGWGGGIELSYARSLASWVSVGAWGALDLGYRGNKTLFGTAATAEAIASAGLRIALGDYGNKVALLVDGGVSWAGVLSPELGFGLSVNKIQVSARWRNTYGDIFMPLAGVISVGFLQRI